LGQQQPLSLPPSERLETARTSRSSVGPKLSKSVADVSSKDVLNTVDITFMIYIDIEVVV
jgi:hypothetical protein